MFGIIMLKISVLNAISRCPMKHVVDMMFHETSAFKTYL